jgi:hypothetical protein
MRGFVSSGGIAPRRPPFDAPSGTRPSTRRPLRHRRNAQSPSLSGPTGAGIRAATASRPRAAAFRRGASGQFVTGRLGRWRVGTPRTSSEGFPPSSRNRAPASALRRPRHSRSRAARLDVRFDPSQGPAAALVDRPDHQSSRSEPHCVKGGTSPAAAWSASATYCGAAPSSNQNALPFPTSDSSPNVPCMRSTAFRTIASPMPVPW